METVNQKSQGREMNRVNRIFVHPLYQEQFQALQKAETDRIFCRHTLEHFLDVARLMYIRSLEEGTGLDKELIYAVSLLHDIGRYAQICCGIPHDQAGADLAGRILPECGFDQQEIRMIQASILAHRGSAGPLASHCGAEPCTGGLCEAQQADGTECPDQRYDDVQELLSAYLYRADKQSRCCFACPARDECNWSEEKRNSVITV